MNRICKALALSAGTAGMLVLACAGVASADAVAQGVATQSPGVLSGNLIQVPIHMPVNLCGNTVNIIGLLNPAFHNTCVNADGSSQAGAPMAAADSPADSAEPADAGMASDSADDQAGCDCMPGAEAGD